MIKPRSLTFSTQCHRSLKWTGIWVTIDAEYSKACVEINITCQWCPGGQAFSVDWHVISIDQLLRLRDFIDTFISEFRDERKSIVIAERRRQDAAERASG